MIWYENVCLPTLLSLPGTYWVKCKKIRGSPDELERTMIQHVPIWYTRPNMISLASLHLKSRFLSVWRGKKRRPFNSNDSHKSTKISQKGISVGWSVLTYCTQVRCSWWKPVFFFSLVGLLIVSKYFKSSCSFTPTIVRTCIRCQFEYFNEIKQVKSSSVPMF